MAEIILIYPELTTEGDRSSLIMPLSLIYVAYPLSKEGYSVKIVDQRVTPDWEADLGEELLKGETICVGISAMTGLQIEGGIRASRIVRRYSGDLPIVWGGVHPSLLPEQTIKDEHVDIVVIGEGERALLEVVKKLEGQGSLADISGLCYMQNGETIVTPPRTHLDLHDIDISLLPYDLLGDLDKYLGNPLRYLPGSERECVPFLSSRGCPFRCSYCYNVKFGRQRWRAYVPERVVEDLRYITGKFGVKGIFLLDDNFFVDLGRVERICELIIERGIKVRFYNVNCRLDTLAKMDIGSLQLLKTAGIDSLFVGIESASRRVLKAMRKSLNVEDIFEIDRKLRSAEIVPTYSFMVGLPVERVEDMKSTMRLMGGIIDTNRNACISPQVYMPLPGSEMFDMCVEKGLVAPKSLPEWAHFCKGYPEDVDAYCWFDEKERHFLKKIATIMLVIDTKMNKRKSASRELLRRIYSSVVRFRIRHAFYGFMPEVRLRQVEWLKLTQKEGQN